MENKTVFWSMFKEALEKNKRIETVKWVISRSEVIEIAKARKKRVYLQGDRATFNISWASDEWLDHNLPNGDYLAEETDTEITVRFLG